MKVDRYERNPVGRDLIVGDIHGCFTKLQAALTAINFDPQFDRLFSVGDLVDRGAESDQVLGWLDKPWFHAVMGNHEQMCVGYAAGDVDRGLYGANGGHWFIGMTEAERLPITDALAALPVAIELETATGLIGIVHAACDFGSWQAFRDALTGERADYVAANAMWGRSRASYPGDFGPVDGVRAVVVGHTPMPNWTTLDNVIFIDTGAWKEGGRGGQRFTILDAADLRPASKPSGLLWEAATC